MLNVRMTDLGKTMILEGKLRVDDVERVAGKAKGKVPINRIVIERAGTNDYGTKKILFCQDENPIYFVEYAPFSGDLILDDLDMHLELIMDDTSYEPRSELHKEVEDINERLGEVLDRYSR